MWVNVLQVLFRGWETFTPAEGFEGPWSKYYPKPLRGKLGLIRQGLAGVAGPILLLGWKQGRLVGVREGVRELFLSSCWGTWLGL